MSQSKREFHYRVEGKEHTVSVTPQGEGWLVSVDGRPHEVSAQPGERGRLSLELNGRRTAAFVAQSGLRLWAHVEGGTWALERSRGGSRSGEKAGSEAVGLVRAAMPGRVLDVTAQEGSIVRKGDTLLLLEAMKMELRIAAPGHGRVARVFAQAGQVIERGAPLVEIVAEGVE